jgi:hypothetical protein
LAHWLRVGGFPAGDISPKAERAGRDWLRNRAPCVRQPTAHVLRGHNSRARTTGARFSVKRLQELTTQARPTWLAAEPQGLAVTRSLVGLDGLRPQSNMVAQSVHTRLPHPPSDEPWLSVQGIGTLWAQTIPLATGALSRFPPVGHAASSCRGVDSTQSRHGKRKGTGNGKKGHPYVAGASREAAPCARRVQPEAQRFSQRKLAKSRTHTVWARKAVAHKRSRACYDRMRDLGPFEAPQAVG